jgi:hypothetical protein
MPETTKPAPKPRRYRQWAFWILFWLIGTAGIGVLIDQSETFSNCVHTRKNTNPYQALHKPDGVFDGAIIREQTRLRLVSACVGEFTETNNGAIAALATIMVGVFTFTLWRTTARLWQTSRDQARHMERSVVSGEKAADAARDSADALAQTERAVVFVVYADDNVGEEENRLRKVMNDNNLSEDAARNEFRSLRIAARYRLKNYGKTPAFLGAIEHNMIVAEILPDDPTYLPNMHVMPERVLSSGGETITIVCQCTFERAFDLARDALSQRDKFVWFFGRATYKDITGGDYEHGFLYRYSPRQRRLIPSEDARYCKDA